VKQHSAGNTWSEITGEVHQVLNVGTVTARTIGTFLLPRGVPLTTIQNGVTSEQLPGPTTLAQAKRPVDQSPAQYDLRHLVLDFAPGASTPGESFGGQVLNLVLTGTVTVRVNGTAKTYKIGESWSNDAGQVFAVANATGEKASIAISVLLPTGASLMAEH
jgi:quercetin dioxygenase-like cupin family protein